MQLHTVLEKAVADVAAVVRGVEPDQLSAPTPCRDWDVHALANHLSQVMSALSLAGSDRAVPDDVWSGELSPDRFESDGRDAVAAWRDPAAWDGAVRFGAAGVMPAEMVATMLVADLAIHGWDLARATGQPFRCAEDVAGLAHGFLAGMAEQGRQIGLFAEPAKVDAGASAFDQALALSGRNPHWSG